MTPAKAKVAVTQTEMPDFIQAINDDYKSQVAHVFLLHGNIYDFCDNSGKDLTVKQVFTTFCDDNFQKDNAKPADKAGSGLDDGETAAVGKLTRILVTYNLSQGLEFLHPESREMMKQAFIADLGADKVGDQFMAPKSPGKMVDFMNLWFEVSKKRKKTNQIAKKQGKSLQEELLVTWLIVDADALFPKGEVSQIGPDRLPIVAVRQWAQDEWLAATNRIILMCRHATDLHESIRSEISAIHMVRKPNLDDRRQYILGFDKIIQLRAKLRGGSLSIGPNTSVSKINWAADFGPEQCAVQSAGMSRKQLKDVFLQSWMQMEPVGYDQVRARKQRALQDEYQGMIDFKEPEFGFEEIGGHDAFKKFCKQQIIMPLQTGDKRTCARGALLCGPPGCQPAGSKVLMEDGSWKVVEDIQVGNKVLSPQQDGSVIVAAVTETVQYKNRDLYEVATKGRTRKSYRCADNHIVPFLYLERPRLAGKRQPRQYKLAELQAADIVGLGVNRKKVVFTSPAIELPEKDLAILSYVLGALLGVGGFTHNLTFTGSPEMLKKLRSLGAVTGKSEYKKGNSLGVYIVDEISQLIRQSKLWGKDSYTKFVPEPYKKASLQQRLNLLSGLIDTDGSIDSFTSCSEQMAKDFVDLVHSVGGFANSKERTTKDQNGKLCKSFRVHFAFAEHRPDLVYKHKDRGIRNMEWKNPRRRDFTVEKVGKGTVFGFILDSPSEWYITDDWMVTHNTGKSMLAWALAREAKMNYLIVDLSKVFGGLVGETEANMRKLLEAIEAAAPCIVFVDELDSVLSAGRTSSGDSGTSGRVFNSFMTFMSDPGRAGKIVVLAATNRPDLLDEALIREGRFDVKIAILPPGKTDVRGRKAILKALSTKLKTKFAKDLSPTLENKEDGLGRLLEDTKRVWTGAAIEVVMKKAISTAAFADRKDEDGNRDYTIQLEDWNHAMDVILPNTTVVEFQTKLALYYVDDLDFCPSDWKYLVMDKDALARELGLRQGGRVAQADSDDDLEEAA